MARSERDATESGVLVYPRIPVPKHRDGESKPPRKRSRVNKVIAGVVVAMLLGGIAIGMIVRPIIAPDARIGAAEKAAEDSAAAAAASKLRADGLEKELDAVNTKKKDVEKKLEVASKAESKLADSAAEADKQAKELDATQKKLAAAMRNIGTVAIDGADLRVTINSGVLFAKDDVLSDRGKQVVDRVGAVLKDMTDKYAWVQGHTDDTPLPLPKPPAAPPPPKKGAKPAPPPPAPPPVRFATNWELSAARAVAVVRHLQESSKLDPTRLSAAGFGQYRPLSRRDKAVNRRIELVLYQRPKK